MSEQIISTTARSSGVIAAEIRTIVRQTRMIVLQNAMEIGRRLCEAKELVPHGEWGEYLEKEVEFSQSTANNMMQLWREYGDQQQSLFGGGTDAFLNLPYTKALKLLAVPAEEREEFAEQVNAEDISVRELEKAIREREAARELCAAAQEQFEAERNRVEQLTAETKQRELDIQKAEKEAAALRRELEKAQAERKAALEQAGKVPEGTMERLRAEAEQAEAEKARAELERQARAAEERIRAAEEKAARAQEQLAEARRQTAAKDGDTAVFAQMFETVQSDFNKLIGQLMKIEGKDEQTAQKLRRAVAAVLDKLREKLGGMDG